MASTPTEAFYEAVKMLIFLNFDIKFMSLYYCMIKVGHIYIDRYNILMHIQV